MSGSRTLFRALLDRCAARSKCMMCYMNTQSHTRPRLVALVPSQSCDVSSDGFHVVQLPLSDDCVDGSAMDTGVKEENDETKEQKAATRALIKRLTAKFTPFENPALQSFYSMLVEYATGEKPKEVEDTIKPYFSNDAALKRVQPQLDAMQEAFGDLSSGQTTKGKTASKRPAKDKDETTTTKKRGKNDGVKNEEKNLEEMANNGELSSLTVAVLRELAYSNGIVIPSKVTRKGDIIENINKHYGV